MGSLKLNDEISYGQNLRRCTFCVRADAGLLMKCAYQMMIYVMIALIIVFVRYFLTKESLIDNDFIIIDCFSDVYNQRVRTATPQYCVRCVVNQCHNLSASFLSM